MILALKLDAGAFKPTKAHSTDAGFDLYLKENLIIKRSKKIQIIDTGVHIKHDTKTIFVPYRSD